MKGAVATPPASESELLARANALAGLGLGEVAAQLGVAVPPGQRRAKGWIGQLIEQALGASAGSRSEPDFQLIGVELKTLPVAADGRPLESTYVCTAPLEHAGSPRWHESNVRRKLARVLWLPVEGERGASLPGRRIGNPLLWSPSTAEERVLRTDWEEFMDLICLGRVAEISAHHGECLQIRPKAADSRARRWGVDEHGERMRTLPRGFYLRASFTAAILRSHYAGVGARSL